MGMLGGTKGFVLSLNQGDPFKPKLSPKAGLTSSMGGAGSFAPQENNTLCPRILGGKKTLNKLNFAAFPPCVLCLSFPSC